MHFARLDFEAMIVRTAPLGPFATNCYVVGCAETQLAAVIDPSNEPPAIESMLAADPELELERLLQTHGHIDHVAAISGVRSARGELPIHLHKDELPIYRSAAAHGQLFGIHIEPLPEPDSFVAEGSTVSFGDLEAKVLHTPGHTPGSVCYYFEKQGVVFTGDLLFAGSIGRTDLPGGNTATIKTSLDRISTLPDNTVVLSGHGPETTIGREKATNPFLRGFF